MEFWNNFLKYEDDYVKIISLTKILEEGNNILGQDILKLQYTLTQDAKQLKEYAQFLIKVVHNYTKGEDVLTRIKNNVMGQK